MQPIVLEKMHKKIKQRDEKLLSKKRSKTGDS